MQLTMDERFMPTAAQAQPISKRRLWTGRGFSGLVVLFLAFDSMGKFFKPAPLVEGFARLGFPVALSLAMTGYLGGAVTSQLRVGEPLFGNVLFPVYFGILLWTGLFLREDRLREFIGLRS